MKTTGYSAIENDHLHAGGAALGLATMAEHLSALSGANSFMETSRRMQEMIQGPALALDRSFEVAVRPVSLHFQDALATAMKPIIDHQAWSLAEMVRLSFPQSFLDAVRALELSSVVRIQELSRVALAGSWLQAFESLRLDWSRHTSALEYLMNAVQAATVAARADVAVPGEPPLQLPDWLTDFADRVRALPPSERRALVFNLLAIIVATASLFVTGTAANGMRATSVALLAIGYVNRLSALYENDEEPDNEDEDTPQNDEPEE